MHPTEIIESFEELNPKVKEAFLRKGLINALPEPLKVQLTSNYIQPTEEQVAEKNDQILIDSSSEQDEEETKEDSSLLRQEFDNDEETFEDVQEPNYQSIDRPIRIIESKVPRAKQSNFKKQILRKEQTQVVLQKRKQLENSMKKILATDWDHHADYKQFLLSRARRTNPDWGNSFRFFESLGLVINSGKFDTKLMTNKMVLLRNVDRINSTSKKMIIFTLLLVFLQLKYDKRSRHLYKQLFLILSSVGLIGLTTFSFGMFMTSKQKKYQQFPNNILFFRKEIMRTNSNPSF